MTYLIRISFAVILICTQALTYCASKRELRISELVALSLSSFYQERFASNVERYHQGAGPKSVYKKLNYKENIEFVTGLINKYKIRKLPKGEIINGVYVIKINSDTTLKMSPADYYLRQVQVNSKVVSLPKSGKLSDFYKSLMKTKTRTTFMSLVIANSYASDWVREKTFSYIVLSSAGLFDFEVGDVACDFLENKTNVNSYETPEIVGYISQRINKAKNLCESESMPFEAGNSDFIDELQNKLNHNTDVTQKSLIIAILGKASARPKYGPVHDWIFGKEVNNCEDEFSSFIASTVGINAKDAAIQNCPNYQSKGFQGNLRTMNDAMSRFKGQFNAKVCQPLKKLKYCIEHEPDYITCEIDRYDPQSKNRYSAFDKCYITDYKMKQILLDSRSSGRKYYRMSLPDGGARRKKGSSVAK